MNTNLKTRESQRLRTTISIRTKGDISILPSSPDPVLLGNMELPAEATYDLYNATYELPYAGHIPITIELFFGDNRSKKHNISLGEFNIEGIQPAPYGPEKISIKLAVSREQVLKISLEDQEKLAYHCLGFIDLSTLETPEIIPGTPETSDTNLVHSAYDRVLELFENPKPRETGLPRSGDDISQKLTLSFDEAFRGTRKKIDIAGFETCPMCSGSGLRPDTQRLQCADCQGTGLKKDEQLTDQGPILHAVTCPTCDGDGYTIPNPCPTCLGRTWIQKRKPLSVNIPALVEAGSVVRILHHGEPGQYGGPPGHLNIIVSVAKDPLFSRVGHYVSIFVPVSTGFAKEGGKLRVPGLEKGETFLLNIPPSTRKNMAFQVHEGTDYILTAMIETYPRFFLWMLPNVKKRLKII